MYVLGDKARAAVEKATGRSTRELMNMDFDEEIRFVESVRGHRPVFSKSEFCFMCPGRNDALGEVCMLDIENIERGFMYMDSYYDV